MSNIYKGGARYAQLAFARRVAIFCIYAFTPARMLSIRKFFNRSCHTSIINAIDKVGPALKQTGQTSKDLQILKKPFEVRKNDCGYQRGDFVVFYKYGHSVGEKE